MMLSFDDLEKVAKSRTSSKAFRKAGPSPHVATPGPVFKEADKPLSKKVHRLRSGADDSPPTGSKRPDGLSESPIRKPAPRRPAPTKKSKRTPQRRYEAPSGDGFHGSDVAPSRQLELTVDDLAVIAARPRTSLFTLLSPATPRTEYDTVKSSSPGPLNRKKIEGTAQDTPIPGAIQSPLPWDIKPEKRKPAKTVEIEVEHPESQPQLLHEVKTPPNHVNASSGLAALKATPQDKDPLVSAKVSNLAVLREKSRPKKRDDEEPTFTSLANTLATSVLLEER